MPSPFPGMDPYLEGELWTSVHTQLGAEIARQLTPIIAPRYLALAEKRFVLVDPEDVAITAEAIYPDVGGAEAKAIPFASGGVGLLTPPALQLATVVPEAVPEVFVEIRDTAERRLVTVIELLSPTNKRGDGRAEYLAKRNRLLVSSAHLVEVDLLREGKRVPMRQPLPNQPYFVILHRVAKRPVADVWPIALVQPLPTVPVPLLDGDADVALDLQRAFTTVYDACRLDLAVDYSQPADVPLPPALATWAEELLRNAGLRR